MTSTMTSYIIGRVHCDVIIIIDLSPSQDGGYCDVIDDVLHVYIITVFLFPVMNIIDIDVAKYNKNDI